MSRDKPFLVIPKTDRSPYRSGSLAKFFNRYKRHVLMALDNKEDILPLIDFYLKLRQEDDQDKIMVLEGYIKSKNS